MAIFTKVKPQNPKTPKPKNPKNPKTPKPHEESGFGERNILKSACIGAQSKRLTN